ncbi:hypothetical protein Acr_05g0000570 [Actinidia rufa]|uniref:Uncharacterized protein n=1 Tax=Actinidia rufa TaxID=165716 RepID=A0A7J0EIX2_9ERIC|nr:hypothetical protein Acr_05g0000570 [Actinidia rufa]
MANENKPQTSPSEGSQGVLPEVDVPSSPATELNTMTQGNIDRLCETYFFPMGVQTRIPGKGEIVLSASSGEVAFYEAAFPTGLRPSKNILKGALNNVKGWKKRFFFILGDEWEFHPTIPREERAVRVPRSWGAPGKQCNKVPILSPVKEERFRQVFKKVREGRFKIPVILNSRTFYKYFAPGQVGVSLSGSGTTKGEVGGEAEGDIRLEVAASEDHASESREETRMFLHASNLDLLMLIRENGPRPLAMSKRIKFSELAKVAAPKTVAPSSKGVAKKIKTGSGAYAAPARLPIVPEEGSSARRILGEALCPQALVMASAAMAEKILAGMILPADKEKVEKLTFDQVVTKFLHVLGQGVILGSFLAVRSRNFAEGALNQRALAKSSEMEMVRVQNRAIELERALAEEKNKGKKAVEDRGKKRATKDEGDGEAGAEGQD